MGVNPSYPAGKPSAGAHSTTGKRITLKDIKRIRSAMTSWHKGKAGIAKAKVSSSYVEGAETILKPLLRLSTVMVFDCRSVTKAAKQSRDRVLENQNAARQPTSLSVSLTGDCLNGNAGLVRL